MFSDRFVSVPVSEFLRVPKSEDFFDKVNFFTPWLLTIKYTEKHLNNGVKT